MIIRKAAYDDLEFISKYDKWINKDTIRKKIDENQIYVVFDGEIFIGWLRYNLFWDNTPFMTMLHLIEEYRGRGIGAKLVGFWENEMKSNRYKVVLTSSAQTEYAQHFYNKLGYKAIGSFKLAEEPLEIIFSKNI